MTVSSTGLIEFAPSPPASWLNRESDTALSSVPERTSVLRTPMAEGNRRFVASLSFEKTLEEQLFDALAAAKIWTAGVAMHMERQWRDKLFAQLDRLHDPEEWADDDKPLDIGSFKTFMRTMLSIRPENRPSLGLSAGGNILAAWVCGDERLLLEFCKNDRVIWTVVRRTEGNVERASGDTMIQRLPLVLQAYRPEDFFLNA